MARDDGTYDVAVVGIGPAGHHAAIQAAKAGRRAVAIDRNQELGGEAVLRGTIPSKSLREAVNYLSGVRQRTFYGRSYRPVTNVTMADLLSRTLHAVRAEADVVRDTLLRNRVELVHGTAQFRDPHTLTVSGAEDRTLRADNIVLATGSRPARPEGVPSDHPRVTDSDGILDLAEIPQSLTVVGAGVVGCEYASIFATLGVPVTLIDGRSVLLDFVETELVDALKYHLRDWGVTLRLGHNVARVDFDARDRPVAVLESGARIVSEMLIYSIGRQGATRALNLAAAGLEADKRGRLQVDAHYRTAVKHIYAVGDLIGHPALAATSAEQGRLAVRHALGLPIEGVAKLLPIGIYTLPEIAMVGMTEADLIREGRAYESGRALYRETARGNIIGDDFGVLKLLFDPSDLRVAGVHIFGTQAAELIHIGQTVIGLGGTVDFIANSVFNYPTFAECYKLAALNGLNKLAR